MQIIPKLGFIREGHQTPLKRQRLAWCETAGRGRDSRGQARRGQLCVAARRGAAQLTTVLGDTLLCSGGATGWASHPPINCKPPEPTRHMPSFKIKHLRLVVVAKRDLARRCHTIANHTKDRQKPRPAVTSTLQEDSLWLPHPALPQPARIRLWD